jgi:hypothetical protein
LPQIKKKKKESQKEKRKSFERIEEKLKIGSFIALFI